MVKQESKGLPPEYTLEGNIKSVLNKVTGTELVISTVLGMMAWAILRLTNTLALQLIAISFIMALYYLYNQNKGKLRYIFGGRIAYYDDKLDKKVVKVKDENQLIVKQELYYYGVINILSLGIIGTIGGFASENNWVYIPMVIGVYLTLQLYLFTKERLKLKRLIRGVINEYDEGTKITLSHTQKQELADKYNLEYKKEDVKTKERHKTDYYRIIEEVVKSSKAEHLTVNESSKTISTGRGSKDTEEVNKSEESKDTEEAIKSEEAKEIGFEESKSVGDSRYVYGGLTEEQKADILKERKGNKIHRGYIKKYPIKEYVNTSMEITDILTTSKEELKGNKSTVKGNNKQPRATNKKVVRRGRRQSKKVNAQEKDTSKSTPKSEIPKDLRNYDIMEDIKVISDVWNQNGD